MFSIIIPTYNRAHLISTAIESVLNQTYDSWELLIIDDGSTDNTHDVVNSFDDPRIYYIYQENAERSAARNKGIEISKGEWICFLDSDDEYLPNHLEVINQEIESNSIPKLIVTGNLIRKNCIEKKHPLLNKEKYLLEEISSKFILMNSVCVHSEILKNNLFDSKFRIWEDTHLWLRIAAQYPVHQIQEYTAVQNIHDFGTVVQGMFTIQLKEVEQYLTAIKDLRDNYTSLFAEKLSANYFNQYIDTKYRMYLYQARQNKQFLVAIHIWWKAIWHKPSWYLLAEFPKIFLNKLNIGIHD